MERGEGPELEVASPATARALGQPFTDAAVLSLTNVLYRLLPSNDPSVSEV
jgi:hypothetical protein